MLNTENYNEYSVSTSQLPQKSISGNTDAFNITRYLFASAVKTYEELGIEPTESLLNIYIEVYLSLNEKLSLSGKVDPIFSKPPTEKKTTKEANEKTFSKQIKSLWT